LSPLQHFTRPLSELEEKYKDKPDILEHIKMNAPDMVNPVTQETLLYVPKFSMGRAGEEVVSETRKVEIESETKIRKAIASGKPPEKKRKTIEDGTQLEEEEQEEEGKDPFENFEKKAQLAIPVPQLARLLKSVEKMQILRLTLATLSNETRDAAVNANIPAKTLTKFTEAQTEIETGLTYADKKTESKQAAKGQMKWLFDAMRDRFTTGKSYAEKMQSLIEDAKS
jgi:hypothetical protein